MRENQNWDWLRGKRLLLTGASGFIGTHLLQRLLAVRGLSLILVSRHTTALMRQAQKSPRVRWISCDLHSARGARQLKAAAGGTRTDCIVHLAGTHPRSAQEAASSQIDPFLMGNLVATVQLIQQFPNGVRFFCYTSTMDVYGPPQQLPIDEKHPTEPATYYGASKLAVEQLLKVFSRRTRTPLTILRLSQVYGPGDTSAKAIITMARSILRHRIPAVQGSGWKIRQYIYVEDVVEAIGLALRRGGSGTYNVAGAEACTIQNLRRVISRQAFARSKPTTRQMPGASVRTVSITQARRQLGFTPHTSLPVGLDHLMQWLRQPSRLRARSW